jgi:hypothetical protein
VKTFATHTEPQFFIPGDKMQGMIELNRILGTKTICCVRGLANSATPSANNPRMNPRGQEERNSPLRRMERDQARCRKKNYKVPPDLARA